MSGVTKQHQQACESLNFCLLVMASVREIKGGTLMWQVQGVASAAFVSARCCLSSSATLSRLCATRAAGLAAIVEAARGAWP